MHTSINLVLFVLVSWAAPSPFAEALTGFDQEAVVEQSQTSRPEPTPDRRRAAPPAVVVVHPAIQDLDSAPVVRDPDGWTPRIFSRPPPRQDL